ncbi:hypothetical protein TURU_000216 [Turdus rufiventris]|nr:hypothetical protein TURU_000216 [Turdus rufiventris]
MALAGAALALGIVLALLGVTLALLARRHKNGLISVLGPVLGLVLIPALGLVPIPVLALLAHRDRNGMGINWA